MTYYFFYVDKNGEEYRFYNLTRRKATMMYNQFLKDMVINQYKKIGWSIDE
jgi:hypothetical protein